MIILYVTFPNKEEAKKVSKHLLDKKIIACSNFIPIESMYWWEDRIHEENEIVALLKTSEDKKEQVKEEIIRMHSYDVPCILELPAKANQKYEEWINSVL